MAALATRLATDGTVRALWLKRNPVGDDGVARLAEALTVNTTIRTLDLVNVGMTARGLTVLGAALAARPARLQVAAVAGHPTMAYPGLNGGVPRKQRRKATELLAAWPVPAPHADVRAIASVYR